MNKKLVSFRVEVSSLDMLERIARRRFYYGSRTTRADVLDKLLAWANECISENDWSNIISYHPKKGHIVFENEENSRP